MGGGGRSLRVVCVGSAVALEDGPWEEVVFTVQYTAHTAHTVHTVRVRSLYMCCKHKQSRSKSGSGSKPEPYPAGPCSSINRAALQPIINRQLPVNLRASIYQSINPRRAAPHSLASPPLSIAATARRPALIIQYCHCPVHTYLTVLPVHHHHHHHHTPHSMCCDHHHHHPHHQHVECCDSLSPVTSCPSPSYRNHIHS